MRRILFFVTDLEIGGTPTVVRELALRLNGSVAGGPRASASRLQASHVREDVIVEVACLGRWGPVADQIADAGVTVTALGMRGPRDFFVAVKKLTRLIDERAIDTVQNFLLHANAVSAAASSRVRGARFFQSVQTTQPWPRWHWWVQRWIWERAERVVVPSQAVARVAVERSDVEPARVCVIPNAVDPAEFETQDVFASSTIRVGFIGRLDPVKNIGALIGAMAQLRELPVECHIFGDGVELAKTQAAVEQFGLGGRVFLRGAVSRPQDALSQIDVMVLPSVGEGFGLVLIEAMASGVPVIAARRGAIGEVVQHERNGLLVDGPGFDREIAAAIRRLIADSSLRRSLIEAGLQTVREKYDWRVVIPLYRKLYGLDVVA